MRKSREVKLEELRLGCRYGIVGKIRFLSLDILVHQRFQIDLKMFIKARLNPLKFVKMLRNNLVLRLHKDENLWNKYWSG